jgi:hypothetical protein
MDEHSQDSVDLENTSASSINMESDSQVSESLNDLETEYDELKKTVKDKMKQLGKRVVLCIKKRVDEDFESDYKELLIQCVGVNYDILDRNFTQFMFEVRTLFKDLVLQELAPFREGNVDTEKLLMDMIEFQAERDFKMLKGFEILKRKIAYYVTNPKMFNDFLEIIEDILIGWDEFLQMIIDLKQEAKQEIKDKLIKREKMLMEFFDKGKKELDSAKDENLEFTTSDESEANGLNEFGELVNENHDQQIEQGHESSSSYSDFSELSEQEEGSDKSGEDESSSEGTSDGTSQEMSSKSSESSIAKSSESSSEGDQENKDENKDEKKEEPKERKLMDVDEDHNEKGEILISKN